MVTYPALPAQQLKPRSDYLLCAHPKVTPPSSLEGGRGSAAGVHPTNVTPPPSLGDRLVHSGGALEQRVQRGLLVAQLARPLLGAVLGGSVCARVQQHCGHPLVVPARRVVLPRPPRPPYTHPQRSERPAPRRNATANRHPPISADAIHTHPSNLTVPASRSGPYDAAYTDDWTAQRTSQL